MTASPAKQKALCVATRCSSIDQFVATFHRFCDETSFFVATMASRPVGLETAFSIQLEDKTPVLRGLCVVVEAWATPANRYGRPGVRLAVKRLTNDSMDVFKQLQTARIAAESKVEKVAIPAPPPPPPAQRPPTETGAQSIRIQVIPPVAAKQTPSSPLPVVIPPKPPAPPPPPPPPALIESERPVRAEGTNPPSIVLEDTALAAATPAAEPAQAAPEAVNADELTTPVATETRTPGSSYVLPANPLMNLTDKSLEGFVECALYEETGNFFRAAEDEGTLIDLDDGVVDPPPPMRPIPALSPTAFVPPTPRDEDFAPDMTPIPALVQLPPTPRLQTDPVAIATGAVARPTPPPLPQPPPAPAPRPARPAPIDSTASLLAMSNPDRKRWLVIGGVAAGTSLLLLIIVLAATGGKGDKTADAAPVKTSEPAKAPDPVPAAAPPSDPAVGSAATVAKAPETAQPSPEADPAPETPSDPNAPPVVGNGPCRVTVTSSPAGSIVTLDDQAYGPSPITIDGPCAKRRVDIKHPRYALGTKWVTLEAGKPSTVDVALARPTHTVTVTSTPSGATVSIAGRPAGTTPTAVKVMGFTGVTLTFEKRGFKTATEKLYSKVDNDRVSVKLVKGK